MPRAQHRLEKWGRPGAAAQQKRSSACCARTCTLCVPPTAATGAATGTQTGPHVWRPGSQAPPNGVRVWQLPSQFLRGRPGCPHTHNRPTLAAAVGGSCARPPAAQRLEHRPSTRDTSQAPHQQQEANRHQHTHYEPYATLGGAHTRTHAHTRARARHGAAVLHSSHQHSACVGTQHHTTTAAMHNVCVQCRALSNECLSW
jgi:hypothetical protein